MTAAISAAVGPDYGFGLYIHWPYCAKICPYCDFNVYAAKDRDTTQLLDAMKADLRRQKHDLPNHPKFDSIFFGGGTPSLLSAKDLGSLIDVAADTFGLSDSAELSLEANPNDVLNGDLVGWYQAGINRLSLGVQSFDDDALKFLGRDHDSATAITAFDSANRAFENTSIDLIYALPNQSTDSWGTQLKAALALGSPHLSLYELTIEPATPFGKQVGRGDWTPLNDDRQADLYELTQSLCDEAGMPAYEVSNHARQDAFESQHNKIYWNSGDWIGLGPGAHGRVTLGDKRLATETARRPQAYQQGVEPVSSELPPLDVGRELVAMALRHKTGLCLKRLTQLGLDQPDAPTLASLRDAGLILIEHSRITLTSSGRLLADHVAAQISP